VNELPKGWVEMRLDDLLAPEKGAITDGPFGSKLKTEHYTESGPRVIRLQNIGDGVFRDEKAHISEERFDTLRKHEARADDVLVAGLGEVLPRACVVPPTLGPAIVKADCFRLRFRSEINPHFVAAMLNSPSIRRGAHAQISGVGRPRLNLAKVRSICIPIPPPEEQDRIVAAIDEQFSHMDVGINVVDRIQLSLPRLRNSIINSALTGGLVEHSANDVSPKVLLEESVLQNNRYNAKRTNWKPERLHCVDLPLPGWSSALAGEIMSWSSGKGLTRAKHEGGSIPVFGGNGVTGYHSTSLVDFPTIVIGRVGAHCGNVYVTSGESWITDNAIYATHLPVGCNLKFLALAFLAAHLNNRSAGSGQPFVNQKTLDAVNIPLPPRAEQDRIVAVVEKSLSRIDHLEVELNNIRTRSHALTGAILNEAFRGGLTRPSGDEHPVSWSHASTTRTKG
jgi:type I restriction enzyme, S subunit